MTLAGGTRLGPYEVLSPLGAGGMGEVYRARDARLGRDVALKVLPQAFVEDPERVARFQREARVLASLNHPNIAAIYGFEEHPLDGGSRHCLVLELVEGQTLTEQLHNGPLALEEALQVARQVAEALEAAHEQGIVHRDLKPGNVKITPEGKVKVLDFGLAKALTGDAASAASLSPSEVVNSPTITAQHTRPGVILGTAAYMSPEQARGRSIDKRTDIWAFGCLLFECLSGMTLFAGETATDSIGAILHKEPEWSTLPPNTPPTVQLLLRRCLAKDRNRRLRDIGDARIELEQAISDPSATSLGLAASALVQADRRPRRFLRRAVTGVALLIAAGAGTGGAWLLRPEPPVRKFEITIENLQAGRGARVSPDGRKIAFVAEDQVWIRDLDRLTPTLLPDTEDGRNLFWSPDSSFVGYMRNGQIWKSSVRGGASVICRMPERDTPVGGGSWCEDGRIVFASGSSGLYEVQAQGGDAHLFHDVDEAVGEEDFHQASLLPDGRGVLYVVHGKDGANTIALFANGSQRVLLHQAEERFFLPIYSPTGHILYQRTRTTPGIWALPFSLAKLEVTGEPFVVVANARQASVSSDGTLVYVQGSPSTELNLAWADRTGKILGKIGQPQTAMFSPGLSPDNTKVAVSAEDGEARDLWIHDVARGTKTRFTFSNEDEFTPCWSPDGKNLAYGIRGWRWAIKPTDGVGRPREMGDGGDADYMPDGKGVVLVRQGKDTEGDLWYLPTITTGDEGEAQVLIQTAADEVMPAVSPDGAYLAYVSDESGRDEVYITRLPGAEGKWQVSVDGGSRPRWNPNGRELFFESQGALLAVEVQTDPSVVLGTPERLFDGDKSGIVIWRWYDVASDGQRFVVIQSEGAEQVTRGITVVENWFAEFKDRR